MKPQLLAQLYRRSVSLSISIFKLEDEMNSLLRNITPEEYAVFQREMMIVDNMAQDTMEFLEKAKWERIRKYRSEK